jgi:hypothetical protein
MLTVHLPGFAAVKTLSVLAAFQAQDSISSGNSRLLMIFIGIVAISMLAQAAVLVGAAIVALKAQKELTVELKEFRAKAAEVLEKSQQLFNDLTPQVRSITAKVETITTHVEQLTALVHQKADEFAPTLSAANQTVLAANQTVQDANLKTRAQINRVDKMVSSALDATVRLGVAIEQGIAKPGREIAGVLSGFKVGFETLLSGARAFGSGAPVGRTHSRPTATPTTPPRPVSPYRSEPDPIYPHPLDTDLSL